MKYKMNCFCTKRVVGDVHSTSTRIRVTLASVLAKVAMKVCIVSFLRIRTPSPTHIELILHTNFVGEMVARRRYNTEYTVFFPPFKCYWNRHIVINCMRCFRIELNYLVPSKLSLKRLQVLNVQPQRCTCYLPITIKDVAMWPESGVCVRYGTVANIP